MAKRVTSTPLKRRFVIGWRYLNRFYRQTQLAHGMTVLISILVIIAVIVFNNHRASLNGHTKKPIRSDTVEVITLGSALLLFISVEFYWFRRHRHLLKRLGLLCPHCDRGLYSEFGRVNLLRDGRCRFCKQLVTETGSAVS
jgi:hypothetical protein